MAKAPKHIELDQGSSVLGAGNQTQVERLLKKAADRAAKDAERKWAKAGLNPLSRHANTRMGGIENALTNALEGALTFHSNNSGPRPSIRMTAPDTGGRPFHFDHTAVSSQTINLKPGATARAARKAGKFDARLKHHTSRSGAHLRYLERDGAAEMIEADLEAAAGIRAEIEAAGRERKPGGMQEYLEDPSKDEGLRRTADGKPATALVFSYGTPDMGETLEQRVAFWDLAEEHARGESGTIQHRLIMELPHEATPEDRLAIMKGFTAKFDEDRVPYHVVLHAPTSKNDDRNYHAHVVLLNRPAWKERWPQGGKSHKRPDGPLVDTWNFAAVEEYRDKHDNYRTHYPKRKKVLPDYRATFVKDQRKRFSDIVNERMAAVGNPVRYDHRSYKAMGLEVDAMKSISRIIKDKAKAGDRIVLDHAQTKRDIEAEIQRIARERAPEYAEVSKVRAAVRAGDCELRQLEKEAAFLRRKPILKRGVHAVKTVIKRKALEYARTKALHVERTIEAIQEIRMLERVVEATRPEGIAQIHAKLKARLDQARKEGNEAEVERLKTEIKSVPEKALTSLLHDVAKDEVERLKAREQRASASRLARVRSAVQAWRQAALGRTANLDPAATGATVAILGVAVRGHPQEQPAPEAKPREHPMWAAYESAVGDLFKTDFEKYMFGVMKRYGQFIIDNADANVPGRTAEDLAAKLVEAVKQHPANAEELIMSYDNGRKMQRLDFPTKQGAQTAQEQPTPTFKRGRVPQPKPRSVKPHPFDLKPLPAEQPQPQKAASEPPLPPLVAPTARVAQPKAAEGEAIRSDLPPLSDQVRPRDVQGQSQEGRPEREPSPPAPPTHQVEPPRPSKTRQKARRRALLARKAIGR